MNRRSFIGTTAGVLAGAATATSEVFNTDDNTLPVQTTSPYSIEIVSPPQHAARELPLFDSYKQAENFALARMSILRQNSAFLSSINSTVHVRPMHDNVHEAGIIKVWTATGHVAFECAWGETWTQSTSYMDAKGNISLQNIHRT